MKERNKEIKKKKKKESYKRKERKACCTRSYTYLDFPAPSS